jgi:hypothetical protein
MRGMPGNRPLGQILAQSNRRVGATACAHLAREDDDVSSSLEKAIGTIHKTPDGWLYIDGVRQGRPGLVLSLVLRKGKMGRRLGEWRVHCRGVREFHISDPTGGGIRLYSSGHPAARQYTAPKARLRCRPQGSRTDMLAALAAAHLAAVDDWVPIERYLPMAQAPNGAFIVQAPDFLVRAYARALRRLGISVRTSLTRPGKARTRPKVLHLGSSYVVAESFEAQARIPNSEPRP